MRREVGRSEIIHSWFCLILWADTLAAVVRYTLAAVVRYTLAAVQFDTLSLLWFDTLSLL